VAWEGLMLALELSVNRKLQGQKSELSYLAQTSFVRKVEVRRQYVEPGIAGQGNFSHICKQSLAGDDER